MMRRPWSDEEGKKMNVEVNQQEGDEEAAGRGGAAASQHENPTRTSKLPPERVVLLVLVSLLAAALIVIYRLSVVVLMPNQTLQTLKKENEALKRNRSGINPNRTKQVKCPPPPSCPSASSCPPPPEVKYQKCLKCEAGWEQPGGKCYYFSSDVLSWTESRRSCVDLGGDLVKIDSREEQMFLETRLRDVMKNDEDKFWIGLTDSQEEGRWFWVDGSPLKPCLSFWSGGEPNNWAKMNPAGEDCVRMEKKRNSEDLKSWDDHSCDVSHRRICEKAAEL